MRRIGGRGLFADPPAGFNAKRDRIIPDKEAVMI